MALFVLLGLQPAIADQRLPNVLLICVDDLRPELGCFGAEYISSPNIDRLASNGTVFRRHYVQSPTCGASRYTLLTGRYGEANNAALFRRAERIKNNAEAFELGLEELLSKKNPIFIEWPNKINAFLPSDTIWVHLEVSDNHTRIIEIADEHRS